ncbi:hypothetical protein CERZMDRAFT_102220 [Cercospora zeae-maydis SCOH1-5]|uniref:Oxidase ustYa n=1 Tax=Cercospora zeae-maydis SCOH1-5 TaxID=717836 RepID=A0A6A6F0Q2_9PEZI|nr:hypothetical protein CERZMDRAFT_102220 [Cercospora zeae-maydis SCOH1-5]
MPKGARYEKVRYDDDDETCDSNESLSEGGEPQSRTHKWLGARSIVTVLSVLVNVALSILLLRNWSPKTQLLEERHGLVPSVPLKLVTFVNQSELFPTYDTSKTFEEHVAMIEQAWEPVLIPGGGFIVIPPSKQQDLGTPMTLRITPGGVTDNLYTISAFHQIHCLYFIYRHWLLLYHGHSAEEMLDGFEVLAEIDQVGHVSHCFDYILQSIKCAADSSLEHGAEEASRHALGTDGMDAVHVCKDWDAFTRFPLAALGDLHSKAHPA